MASHTTTRKAQMEMIGLAFVVIIMVLGLLFYLLLASSGGDRLSTSTIREWSAYGLNLESAMLDTDMEGCAPGYSLRMGIQDCVRTPTMKCGSTPICTAAHDAMGQMLYAALNYEGSDIPYRAFLRHEGVLLQTDDGRDFLFENDCAEDADTHAGPRTEITTYGTTVEFQILFCS